MAGRQHLVAEVSRLVTSRKLNQIAVDLVYNTMNVVNDLKYALRTFLKQPLFTIAAVVAGRSRS